MLLSLLLVGSVLSDPIYPPPSHLWFPSPFSVPLFGNYLYFLSSTESFTYTPLNSLISLSQDSGLLEAQVQGNQAWTGFFQVMSSLSTLERGYYAEIQRFPAENETWAGMLWEGQIGFCGEIAGWMVIDEVQYRNQTLSSIKLRFEQICDGDTVLHGAIRWSDSDNRQPPGPKPIPSGLWAPPALPSGNVLYLSSQLGDYIGLGSNYTYTHLNAVMSIEQESAYLVVSVHGNEKWNGYFQPMSSVSRLKRGFYGNLKLYPDNNPAVGGLAWEGCGRQCNSSEGWFAIDDAQYNGTAVVSLSLRFAQYCDDQSSALFGALTWAAANPSNPPGPVRPPPAWLWAPKASALPTGNYIYLQSQPGERLLQGLNLTYTSEDSVLEFALKQGLLKVTVNGDKNWQGEFKPMAGLATLEPGYYGNLIEYPHNNPALGGLVWAEMGLGCENVTGWFAVDEVAMQPSGLLERVAVRFEQHCEGASALNGAILWDTHNPVTPPGPISPSPGGLWSPGPLPYAGNYLYLESQLGDVIGEGLNYTYMEEFIVQESSGYLSVTVNNNGTWWMGAFQVMLSLSSLEAGYYGDLGRYPYQNPARGGLAWTCEGRGCSTAQGWVVIDQVTYAESQLVSVQLRFEQHCNGAQAALHGVLNWQAGHTYVSD